MLEIINVSCIIDGKKILDEVNLKIKLNSFVAITGPNGSGKSTLAKVIMGLMKVSSGKILLDGTDITDLSVEQRANLGISFAFQQPVKFKGLTVLDILKLSTKCESYKDKIDEVLNLIGLNPDEYLTRELDNTLSGGELKRIEIASVLLRESKLVIFDEPEAGIDIWSFNELIELFNKYKNANSNTLIISHQEKILKIADEIILLKNGKVAKIGTYDEVIENG